MKKEYQKPFVEVVEFDIEEKMMGIIDGSMGEGEGEEDWE